MQKNEMTTDISDPVAADRLEIVFYTDPLCCWSRAVQPQLGKLQQEWETYLQVRYCLCGMIESWQHYRDEDNAVYKPIQMGPLWMQASHITGIPMNSHVWVSDPPQSSYLACTAVKAVQLQDAQAGAHYFKLLQDALMEHSINIALQSRLVDIAAKLVAQYPSFDLERFKQDLVNGNGFNAFAADLAESRARNITRFPTLIISAHNRGIVITGYKPFNIINDAIRQLVTTGQ